MMTLLVMGAAAVAVAVVAFVVTYAFVGAR
jgi:hypothetical protein